MKKILLLLAALFLLASPAQTQDANKVCAVFFYIPNCSYCATAEESFKALEEKYPTLEIKRHNGKEEIKLLYELYQKYAVPKYNAGYLVWEKFPVLFIGSEYYIGSPPIINNFEKEIQKHAQTGIACAGSEELQISQAQAESQNSNPSAESGTGFFRLASYATTIIIILSIAIICLALFLVKKGKDKENSQEIPAQEEKQEITGQAPVQKKKRK